MFLEKGPHTFELSSVVGGQTLSQIRRKNSENTAIDVVEHAFKVFSKDQDR